MCERYFFTFCWLFTSDAFVGQQCQVTNICSASYAGRQDHVMRAFPNGFVWPMSIEGSDALPLGAMPIFGVAPDAFSLQNNASHTGNYQRPQTLPISEAVNSDFLPGCTLIRDVLSRAECEALITLIEKIGFLDVDAGKNTQAKQFKYLGTLTSKCKSSREKISHCWKLTVVCP